jgi:hypothetical protein
MPGGRARCGRAPPDRVERRAERGRRELAHPPPQVAPTIPACRQCHRAGRDRRYERASVTRARASHDGAGGAGRVKSSTNPAPPGRRVAAGIGARAAKTALIDGSV